MSDSPFFRDPIRKARAQLAAGRASIYEQHRSGSPGIQVCARQTELIDTVILGLYDALLTEVAPVVKEDFESNVALVAHGGYGRRELAPWSDVDLMVLHAPGTETDVFPLASQLLRDVFDTGLELAQSVRTQRQAWSLAAQDPIVCTSLVECRFLAGNPKLFESFFERFERRTRARCKSLFRAIHAARKKERVQYGETVYLLEPNVKRTRGGLRDLQLVRWLGFARYGAADPDALQLVGAID
jgi:[protein-PII] uridylyltransferase